MTKRSTFVDIDAAFAEHQFASDPITIRVVGREWTFPGNMPSMVLLRMARWSEQGRVDIDELSNDEAITLVGDVIPDDYLRQWSAAGLDILDGTGLDPRMEMILEHLMAEWVAREAMVHGGGDDVGEPQAANVPPPYFGTGETSKPTSPVSTGSTSPQTSQG